MRHKGKSVSFDAMVKFFMHTYNIPTKKDVDKLMNKLEQIEKLLKSTGRIAKRGRQVSIKNNQGKKVKGRSGSTAVNQVIEAIKGFKQGAGLPDIKEKTGFDEKKVRNIIFRLNKNGVIKRQSRGVYIAK
jgi:transcription initiation factor IIE alpha subunit